MNKKEIDWNAIEPDYRAGIKDLRSIAAEHSTPEAKLTEGAIRKHAKTYGWERDLSGRIALRTESKVRKAEVRKQSTQMSIITENKEIEVRAQNQADLILAHRDDIGKYQSICNRLLDELSVQSLSQDELSDVAELAVMIRNGADTDDDPKAVERRIRLFEKTLGLGDRADTFRKLVEAKSRLVALERQAFGVKDVEDGKPQSPVNFYLNMMGGSTAQIAIVDKDKLNN
jgi:hypothetical protein